MREIERDAAAGVTRTITSYGSRYESPLGAKIEEHYDGLVGVKPDDPGESWVDARARYAIAWPEASVATEAVLRIRSTSTAYDVVVEVIASEDGPDGIGRIERRFERRIPRRLQ